MPSHSSLTLVLQDRTPLHAARSMEDLWLLVGAGADLEAQVLAHA